MNLIDQFLEAFEPSFQIILEKYQQDNETDFNSYEIEMFRLDLTYNIINSFVKYTSDNDKLISFEYSYPNISCIIERNNTNHFLNTEMILAGGYNIQKLHNRYLTKTNLPKSSNTFSILKDIKEKKSKLTKIEKIKKDILLYEDRIINKKYFSEIEKNGLLIEIKKLKKKLEI